MKKPFVLLMLLLLPLTVLAIGATYNAKFQKHLVQATINGREYTDVIIYIESSPQGYETTLTTGLMAGSPKVVHPWVRVKMVHKSTGKKIYKKRLMRSCLFVFDEGRHLQIGQSHNVSIEGIMDLKDDGWHLSFDETGNLPIKH